MTTSPKTDLASLLDGTRYLTRRPVAALGIATLGMLLAALAALLQIQFGLPDDQVVDTALTFASLLPLELYFIPRFIVAADASTGRNPFNTPEQWRLRFEERWQRAFWGKAGLALATGVGLSLFFFPGLMVLMAFGWVPLRILLRGESIPQAIRGSLRMMALGWRRVLFTVSAMAMIYLASIVILSYLIGLAVPDLSVRTRLVHPLIWVGNFCGCALNLWLSTCLLALFQRVEEQPTPGAPPAAQD